MICILDYLLLHMFDDACFTLCDSTNLGRYNIITFYNNIDISVYIYMIFLSKKDNKKFSNVLLKFLLYGITSVSVYILIVYGDNFINGYTPTDWVGNSTGSTYYGIQAI